MNDHLSKRAQLLAEILRYINDGNYERAGEAWSFGWGTGARVRKRTRTKPCFRKCAVWFTTTLHAPSPLNELPSQGPPAIDSLAPEFKKLMDELTPETREALGQAFVPIAAGLESQVPESTPPAKGQLDALDRYYSEEILDKLDGIVSRASALNSMGLEIVPNRRVQFLFEEAHRCYLYGFHLACAVFCRAILEGVLKEIADPQSETSPSIHDMIAVAMEKSFLTDDRPRCARDVAKAGNKAIHDPEMFHRDYSAEGLKKS
jgi:hypothetical protein